MHLAQPLNEHSIPRDWLDDNLELDEEDELIIVTWIKGTVKYLPICWKYYKVIIC